MITEESVREVIDTARIEDVVGDFVNLKRRGNNYTGLCPFHNEKTPSFNVNPARNIYKCFGCGEGGDPVKFLMQLEQLSFPDAIRWIAGKYNLKLEEKEVSAEVRAEIQEKDSLLIVNEFARKYYADQLYHTDEGKSIGLSYFKSRGFLKETMETFGLGYAPVQRDGLYQAATAAGFPEQKLEKLGLVRNKRDFFRDRVMFTIHDLSGKPIAFAGRILKKDVKAPKYVNSPETEVYHKSDVVYGMHQARQSVRKLDNLYMVEGYTDVISLHQNGIRNVVATSGTSLTAGQAKLVKRFTENVTLLYDGDKAGIKAALRGVDVLLLAGLNVRVVILPDGQDPDSYMQSVGTTAFEEYLTTTRKDFLFFKADLLLEEADGDVAARTSAIRDIGASLALVEDPLKRAGYIQQFATRLGIEESLLINLVNTAVADRRTEARKDREREERRQGRERRMQGSPTSRPSGPPPPLAPSPADDDEGWAGLVEPGWDPGQLEEGPPMRGFADGPPSDNFAPAPAPIEAAEFGHGFQEKHLAELLIRFGDQTYEPESNLSVAAFLTTNIGDMMDMFDSAKYLKIVTLARQYLNSKGVAPSPEWYLHHPEEEVRAFAQTATVATRSMSGNWKEKYGMHLSQKVPEENYKLAAETFLVNFRLKKLTRKIGEVNAKFRSLTEEAEIRKYLKLQSRLGEMLTEASKLVGNVVIR